MTLLLSTNLHTGATRVAFSYQIERPRRWVRVMSCTQVGRSVAATLLLLLSCGPSEEAPTSAGSGGGGGQAAGGNGGADEGAGTGGMGGSAVAGMGGSSGASGGGTSGSSGAGGSSGEECVCPPAVPSSGSSCTTCDGPVYSVLAAQEALSIAALVREAGGSIRVIRNGIADNEVGLILPSGKQSDLTRGTQLSDGRQVVFVREVKAPVVFYETT